MFSFDPYIWWSTLLWTKKILLSWNMEYLLQSPCICITVSNNLTAKEPHIFSLWSLNNILFLRLLSLCKNDEIRWCMYFCFQGERVNCSRKMTLWIILSNWNLIYCCWCIWWSLVMPQDCNIFWSIVMDFSEYH